jgi:hypothetical protein
MEEQSAVREVVKEVWDSSAFDTPEEARKANEAAARFPATMELVGVAEEILDAPPLLGNWRWALILACLGRPDLLATIHEGECGPIPKVLRKAAFNELCNGTWAEGEVDEHVVTVLSDVLRYAYHPEDMMRDLRDCGEELDDPDEGGCAGLSTAAEIMDAIRIVRARHGAKA